MPAYSSPFKDWPKNEDDLINVSFESLQLVYDEATLRLKDSIEASNIIEKKSTNFLTVIIAAFTGIVAFYISEASKGSPNTQLIKISLIALSYLFILSAYFLIVIKPSFFKSAGTEPKFTLNKRLIARDNEVKGATEKLFLTLRIKSYDQRIFENAHDNREKSRLLFIGMWGLYCFPIFILLIAGFCFKLQLFNF